MDVTQEEIAWALHIKRAARAHPKITHPESITDFEFLQYAIVTKGDVKKAIDRLIAVQRFKERYGIKGDGSLAEAAHDLHAYQILRPGFLLSVAQVQSPKAQSKTDPFYLKDYDDILDPTVTECSCSAGGKCSSHQGDLAKLSEYHGCCPHIACVDLTTMLRKKIKSAEADAVSLRALFYFLQSVNCDAVAIRSGYCHLADATGLGMRNFHVQNDRRAAKFFGGKEYPVIIRNFCLLNTNWLVTSFYGVITNFAKPFVRRSLFFVRNRDSFLFGTDKELGSPRIWYTPDVLPKSWGGALDDEDGTKYFLGLLEERYQNAASFQLPE